MFYRRRRLQLLCSLLVIVCCAVYLVGVVVAPGSPDAPPAEPEVFATAWTALRRDFHRPIDERSTLRALGERTRSNWAGLTGAEAAGLPSYVEPTPWDSVRAVERFQLFLDRLQTSGGPSGSGRRADYVAVDTVAEVLSDSYSAAFDPLEYADYQNRIEQNRVVGIGLEVEARGQDFLVIAVWPGSPAERSGVLPGDVLAEWDGTSLSVRGASPASESVSIEESRRSLTVPELNRELSTGEAGAQLTAVFLREKQRYSRTFEREILLPPSVTVRRLPSRDDVGLISVHGFHDRSLSGVLDAWERLAREGVAGVILDLRDCTGGYLVASLQLSSLFLDSGTPVVIIDSHVEENVRYAVGGKPRRGELLLLVNGRTASAAEVLAAALQDHRRATVMGWPTFGKGSVQKLVHLPDGGAYKFTTATYKSPSGTDLEGVGVQPDLVLGSPVSDDAELWARVAEAIETIWMKPEE